MTDLLRQAMGHKNFCLAVDMDGTSKILEMYDVLKPMPLDLKRQKSCSFILYGRQFLDIFNIDKPCYILTETDQDGNTNIQAFYNYDRLKGYITSHYGTSFYDMICTNVEQNAVLLLGYAKNDDEQTIAQPIAMLSSADEAIHKGEHLFYQQRCGNPSYIEYYPSFGFSVINLKDYISHTKFSFTTSYTSLDFITQWESPGLQEILKKECEEPAYE